MSAESLPISAARFASALNDLPISSLHGKVVELRNSIAHLEKSNKELEEFARNEDDKECYEALVENREVISRMEERIELVRREIVEVRGLPFEADEQVKNAQQQAGTEGGNAQPVLNGTSASETESGANAAASGGSGGSSGRDTAIEAAIAAASANEAAEARGEEQEREEGVHL